MAVSWFLILVICVMVVVLGAINVYVLVHYSHPDDKNEAWFPKILVVLGLLLSEASILALPLDVANNSNSIGCQQGWLDNCGGLNMYLFWEITYVVTTLLCVVVLPFAIFYYESDDGLSESKLSPVFTGIKYTFACIVVSGIILGVCYTLIGKIRIPVRNYSASISRLETIPVNSLTFIDNTTDTVTLTLSGTEITTMGVVNRAVSKQRIQFASSFIVYMIALVSFVGWFLFVLFAGIGLASLPMDLITAFMTRPKPLSAEQLAHEQLTLQTRTVDLIEVGELLRKERKDRRARGGNYFTKSRAERADRSTLNKFKQMVYLLEEDYDKFKKAKDIANYNPLVPFFQLLCGIIAAFISALWIIHVFVYMFFYPPESLFLNQYFLWFDQWFPLFGTCSIALFSLYLLFCVVSGNFKFGIRLLCISLHPMKINGTYMNSFLFNLIIILLCTFPTIEFCTEAFAAYARFSNIYQFFGVQIKYLVFFEYFWGNNVFVYALLGLAFLSTFYFFITPRDNVVKAEDVKSALRRRHKI